MARIYTNRIVEGMITLARGAGTSIGAASAVIAADSATLNDASIPFTQALDCRGYDSIFVGCEIAGGTNPSLTIELLFRDSEAGDNNSPATGIRWRRLIAGSRDGVTAVASPAALETVTVGTGTAPSTLQEMRTWGHRWVFPRITAVANTASTTGFAILVKGGQLRPTTSRRFKQ